MIDIKFEILLSIPNARAIKDLSNYIDIDLLLYYLGYVSTSTNNHRMCN